MNEVVSGVIDGKLGEEEYKKKVHSINVFERQLCDNGYLVMKFFFHISKKEQKKRLDNLLDSKDTKWQTEVRVLWRGHT